MSEDNSKIALNLDETNQLLFKMNIKGTNKSPSFVRLVFEGHDLAYSVVGALTSDDDIYKFDVPILYAKLDEGSYRSRVEVIVDGRYFAPVEFDTEFKRPMTVQAESLVVTKGCVSDEPGRPGAPVVNEEQVTTVRAEMAPVTRQKYSLRETYSKKGRSTNTVEPSNVPFETTLRKIVREAVRETHPPRSHRK